MSEFSLPRDSSTPINESARARRQGSTDWKFSLMGGLADQSARRVFTAAEFHHFVREYRLNASASTARTLSAMLVSAGVLHRVSSGIFLNRRAIPPAELAEAAAHIRAGAVISLHSVLGECGFLNNPSAIVMAVLPASATKRPRLGEVETSTGDKFHFFGLAEKFFPVTSEERGEMLQPGRPCEMFRPEAALLQWLHLANMRRSTLVAPPMDVDMEQLDMELLGRLSERWAVQRYFNDWFAQAQGANFGEAAEPSPSRSMLPTQHELDETSAAPCPLDDPSR